MVGMSAKARRARNLVQYALSTTTICVLVFFIDFRSKCYFHLKAYINVELRVPYLLSFLHDRVPVCDPKWASVPLDFDIKCGSLFTKMLTKRVVANLLDIGGPLRASDVTKGLHIHLVYCM